MLRLSEKISYLKGLSEGMNVAESGPQGKLIVELLDVMSDMANVTGHIKQELDDFKIYVESIDEDLYDLEEDIYGDEDVEFAEMTCRHCGADVYFDADVLDDDESIEVICPNCSGIVYVNDSSLDLQPDLAGTPLESSSM
ncbi:MAG: CD1247 N-terminal domain-containing protein [Solirubrobacterales bacterium]